MIVVIHGPARTGKTHNAEKFRRHFGCARIVDDWWTLKNSMVRDGDLLITNESERRDFLEFLASVRSCCPAARIIPIALAHRLAGTQGPPQS
jgi:hypothetical protein